MKMQDELTSFKDHNRKRDISPIRTLSCSRVTFDIAKKSTNLDRTHPPNTLLRTHTVEHGIPVGHTLYSSANFGAIRVLRHGPSEQVSGFYLSNLLISLMGSFIDIAKIRLRTANYCTPPLGEESKTKSRGSTILGTTLAQLCLRLVWLVLPKSLVQRFYIMAL